MANASESKVDVENPNAHFTNFTADDTRTTLSALSAAVLASNALPRGDTRFIALLTDPALSASWGASLSRTGSALASALAHSSADPSLRPENIADSFDTTFADSLDESLDRAHTALDAAEGFRQTPLTSVEDRANMVMPSHQRCGGSPELDAYMASDFKPQQQFYDFPIDNSTAPFVPPFSAPPTPAAEADDGGEGSPTTASDASSTQGKHPYAAEIKASVKASCNSSFDPEIVSVFRAIKKTPLTYVDTEGKLMEMAEKLSKSTELAFDIENHSERSFLGFTCLIQVSTRTEDFIVDAMALRALMHRALASILADASIVKVFHGADNDMEWLERDFGMYVVNMFDTGQASRALNYPLASLSYLLGRFCDIKTENKKKFQRSDWRQRPLPQDMLDYARGDTHYLLYVYDRLRVELFNAKKLNDAYRRSSNIALRRFRKPNYSHNIPNARMLAAKNGLGFNPNQILALHELILWRETVARKQDESMHFVLPNFAMYAIVRAKHYARNPNNIIDLIPRRCKPPIAVALREEIANVISTALDTEIDAKLMEELEKKPKRSDARRIRRLRTVRVTANSSENSTTSQDSRQASPKPVSNGTTRSLSDKAKRSGSQTRPKRHAVPKAPVMAKKQSDLLHASSDESEVEVVEKTAVNAAPVTVQPDTETDSHPKMHLQAVKPSKSVFDLDDSDDDLEELPTRRDATNNSDAEKKENQANASTVVQVRKSAKSVFDLSESESDAHSTQLAVKRADKAVTGVLAGIEKTSRASLVAFSKLTESIATEVECTGSPLPDPDIIAEPELEPEVEHVPLNMRGAKARGKRKNNRKNKQKSAAEPAPRVAPFDYAAAAEEDKAAKKNDPDAVDGAQRYGQRKYRRPRRTKKNPASGSRSMTFKS